jgi:hypothetical protein
MVHGSTTTEPGSSSHSVDELRRCAETCFECYRVCTETVQSCLSKGGMHATPEHIAVLLDCARICQVSGDFLLRGSPRHQVTCEACATICEECAADCRKMSGDEEMARCAEVCTRCAESCRHMSAH